MEEPQLAHQFRGLKGDILSLQFHPQSKQIAAASRDSNIMTWNFSSEQNLKAFRYTGHSDSVLDLNYSPSGQVLASSSSDRSIRLWALKSLKGQSTEFKGHTGPVRSIEFSSDGTQLLSGSDDKSIKLWTVEKQRFIRSLTGHKHWVRKVRWSPENNDHLLASVSEDKTLRVWDERTGRETHSFTEPGSGYGNDLSFHPSGSCIAIGTSDKKVKIYDIRANRLQQSYSSHTGPVHQVSFHPSGCYLLSCSSDGFLKMFDIVEAQPVYGLTGHKDGVRSLAFSPKGEYFASGGSDSIVLVWKSNIESPPAPLEEDTCTPSRVLSELNLNSGRDEENKKPRQSILVNKEDSETNAALKSEVKRLKEKVETLTQTVFYMEKRMTIMEEQLQLFSRASEEPQY